MHEELVSRAAVLAILFWAVAGFFVLLTWVLALEGMPQRYLLATAVTTVGAFTVAAVWQIRLYITRLAQLVRVGCGLERPEAELHSVR